MREDPASVTPVIAPGVPVINGHDIVREIDRGGAAIVYLAHERKHGRAVAIKVLKAELTESLQAERFLREIDIVANLSHPHILPLLDSGRAGSLLYYITPYVNGESLRSRLGREPKLSVEESMRITCEVAHALEHAHRQGIVHRDVKPENILLSDGLVQVADFGIARAVDLADDARTTQPHTTLGTPAYMSPEQIDGESEADGRSDIYALGCVLYELLTGHPPFQGTPSKVFAQHAAAPVPSLRRDCPLVPYALQRVVTKMLAKAPADRYATAGAVATAIDDVTARAARWLDAWRGVRRARLTPWMAAAIVIFAIATCGVRSAIMQRSPEAVPGPVAGIRLSIEHPPARPPEAGQPS